MRCTLTRFSLSSLGPVARRLLALPALLAASLSSAACGGGGGGSDAPEPLPGIYVDAVNGSNANTGAFDSPFKTITRAITAARIGDTVRVAAGTYDAALGESFPIRPGFGVTIIGSYTQLVTGVLHRTFIKGGALWSGDINGRLHAALIPNDDNTIIGISVDNPQPFVVGGAKPAALILAFARVTVQTCALHDSDKGVRMIEGASNTLLTGCLFTRNNSGIFVEGAGLGNRVQGCRLTENGNAVMNFTGGVDFGDGPAGSTGGNAFARSTSNDFIHFTGANEILYAGRCFWDNAPPTVAVGNPAPVANTDIWVVGAGSVMSGGAQAFQPDPFDLPVGGVLANP